MITLPELALDVVCGEPFDRTVPVLDAANTPVPSGQLSAARAQVRSRVDDGEVLYEWTTSGAAPNAAVTAGGVRLQATATETLGWMTAWPQLRGVWDLLVVDTAGTTHRLIGPSPITLTPVVTR